MTDQVMVQVRDLVFAWPRATPLIRIDALALRAGQTHLVFGPSGCGKSSLLSLLTGVLPISHGEVWVAGQALHGSSEAHKDAVRRKHIGYVFQQFNLLPYLSARDNMLLTWRLRGKAGTSPATIEARLVGLCQAFGLPEALLPRPANTLSVGQQQRVAAVRALLLEPDLLVADEPTSSLDSVASQALMQALIDQTKACGTCLLVVSHDHSMRGMYDHQFDFASFASSRAQGAVS